jgi:hypothetical protein
MDFWDDIATAKAKGTDSIECWECRYWKYPAIQSRFEGVCKNTHIMALNGGQKTCRYDDFCIYGKPVVYCPLCGSRNTTRFQWVDNDAFEYWTCWDCDYEFTVGKG